MVELESFADLTGDRVVYWAPAIVMSVIAAFFPLLLFRVEDDHRTLCLLANITGAFFDAATMFANFTSGEPQYTFATGCLLHLIAMPVFRSALNDKNFGEVATFAFYLVFLGEVIQQGCVISMIDGTHALLAASIVMGVVMAAMCVLLIARRGTWVPKQVMSVVSGGSQISYLVVVIVAATIDVRNLLLVLPEVPAETIEVIVNLVSMEGGSGCALGICTGHDAEYVRCAQTEEEARAGITEGDGKDDVFSWWGVLLGREMGESRESNARSTYDPNLKEPRCVAQLLLAQETGRRP